jgi:peptidoglycan/xylan/chitin deacetylase (PgdA/CDA1 family)
LSFDDGPVASIADSLIEVLAARGVRATFFVIGRDLASTPDVGRRLVAAGHELGNHSYSHKRMVLKSPGFIRREVETTDSLIRSVGELGEIFFRPPYGYKLVGLPWFLSRTNRTTVTWSIEPDSYEDVAASAGGIVAHVLEKVHPGSIIILHPWYARRATSRAAVPILLDSLLARGYSITTVGELLRHERRPTPRSQATTPQLDTHD